jgi:polar amino acid transport system substrate-binding protein
MNNHVRHHRDIQMNKNLRFMRLIALVLSALLLAGCDNPDNAQVLRFATAADYPPFEYMEKGEIKGFDIDVANLIGQALGKKVVFENMQFSNIFAALANHQVDAAISTFTITQERQKNFDFSDPYYFEDMAVIFKKEAPFKGAFEFTTRPIACQLGSTMDLWLKEHYPHAKKVNMDHGNQAVEALKAGHVQLVLLDTAQAAVFIYKNPALSYMPVARADQGYGIVFQKGSPLKESVNVALKNLIAKGEIQKCEQKWLKDMSIWKH